MIVRREMKKMVNSNNKKLSSSSSYNDMKKKKKFSLGVRMKDSQLSDDDIDDDAIDHVDDDDHHVIINDINDKNNEDKDEEAEEEVEAEDFTVPDVSAELLEAAKVDSELYVSKLNAITNAAVSLRSKVSSLLESVQNGSIETSKGVSLLELKCHSLLSYLTNMCTVMLLRVQGQSIESSPPLPEINRLIELRVVLEKVKPLEQKLKYQIDKLVRAANDSLKRQAMDADDSVGGVSAKSGTAADNGVSALLEDSDPLQFKPNPMNLLGASIAQDAEPETKSAAPSGEPSGIYRPPRIAPMPYDEEKLKRKKGKMSDRGKEQVAKSSIMRDLIETLGVRPEERSAHGLGYGPRDKRDDKDEELEAIQRAEEENYTRYSRTKDLNKREKQMRRRGGMAGIQNEIESLENHFDHLHAVDQAVQEDDSLRYGGGVLQKRNRRSEELFHGPGVNRKKAKFSTAGDLLSTTSKKTVAAKTSFEKGLKRQAKPRKKKSAASL